MVIEKTCLKGIPVVEGADGSLTLYILHLFSGRRRTGDCGSFLHEVWQQHFGTTPIKVVLLSVDTAVDEKLGNLDTGHSWDMILSLAQAGAFGLGLGGPPCETWSAARHIELGREGTSSTSIGRPAMARASPICLVASFDNYRRGAGSCYTN